MATNSSVIPDLTTACGQPREFRESLFVDNREQFGIRKANSERGLHFTMVVRFLLLVGAVIDQEHADAASASFPILHIFRSTQPRCSRAIPGEAPTPDPPLKPSR